MLVRVVTIVMQEVFQVCFSDVPEWFDGCFKSTFRSVSGVI